MEGFPARGGPGRNSPSMHVQKIEKLPDYPALRQVQNALWKIGEVHGAAVMVGAGFSQFADRAAETTPLAPLWTDFQKAMLDELYPEGGGPCDPLVLAEEYRAALGVSALENLIRCRVRNDEWSPGGIHRRMLSLPWADVLTTNWDTLLERSVDFNPDLSYDIVRIPSDIARTRSPRIVKLHGSLPSPGPLIFTEEDFRTYPSKFAPFVNLARQVLLENELCLIGFSGDDPNFLEWSGWVRDQLGDAARPIRLIGNLFLSASRRRLLEGRNITPIDLAPLVADCAEEDRHRRAIEIFLNCLEKGRPPKATWSLTPKDENVQRLPDSDSRLTRLMEIWAQDREAHPGWLVTPSLLRASIRDVSSEFIELLESDLSNASKGVRASILYEAVWRWETAFWPLPGVVENFVSDVVVNDDDSSLPLRGRILLRAAIVRASRRKRDWVAFDQCIQFLDRLKDPAADVEARYERCLRARDELDYTFVAANAEGITGHDPIWLLRRAALTAEVADSRTAAMLIHEAHREIQKRRAQDRRSIWLLSREAWAAWLMRSSRFVLKEPSFDDPPDWPLDYTAAGTDPWDELRHLDEKIANTEREQRDASRDRHPQFDAGVYRGPGIRFSSGTVTSPYNDLVRLAEHVGIPIKFDMCDILGSRFSQAVQVSEDHSPVGIWASVRAVATNDHKLIDHRFSRVAIARLPLKIISDIAERVRGAIEFRKKRLTIILDDGSTGQNVHWVDHIRNLTELLSRFGMLFQGTAALDLFRFGTSLAHDPNVKHWFHFESLQNLLRRSLQALEPERRGEAALDVLLLPLLCEKEVLGREFDWTEVFNTLGQDAWRSREQTDEWSLRIASLIKVIADGSSKPSREDATFRIFKLFEAGALTDSEISAFGDAIWRHTGDDGFPADTNPLPPYVFLKLPSPDPDAPQRTFDAAVVKKLAQGSFDTDLLQDLYGASYSLQGKHKPYTLDREDALCILSHALQWQRRTAGHPLMVLDFNRKDDRIADLIGRALASTVLPSLSPSVIGGDRTRALMDRASNGSLPALLMALPALVRLDKTIADEVTSAVQKGLISRHSHVVTAALTAVGWFERFARQGITTVPKALVDDTISICLMRREPGLIAALHCVRLLTRAGVVSTPDQHRLVDALALLRTETNYENWLDESRRSDVGLIRKEAVRLAAALKDAGTSEPVLNEWLADARSDPMPEVRYALSVDQET